MRTRTSDSSPHGTDHQAAVARRLSLLAAELAQVRGADATPPGPEAARVGSGRADGPDDAGTVPPMPGRHAHRRGVALGSLLGRAPTLGPGALSVVALLVAAGVGLTAWWVLGSRPVALPTVAPAAPLVTPAGQPVAVGTPSSSPSGALDQVVVDVAGKVRRPGIVVLAAGARVVDAIEEAGGARAGVDLTSINLARPLVDGEQIVVGLEVPTVSGLVAGAGAASATGGALVNLNTADAGLLETLPRVGPVTAQAILAWRDQHGGFTAVEELLEVDGIGEATLEQIAPHVTL